MKILRQQIMRLPQYFYGENSGRAFCALCRTEGFYMSYFENVKKNFGFGCMRLPMNGKKVDYEQFCRMIDMFLEVGFNYFDTAHGYLDGESEIALYDCLVKRYPRDAYVIADKLTAPYFDTEADVKPFFERQLKILGVDYVDFYLMHAQNAKGYGH